MSGYSLSRNLAFIHVPKCAGTSIRAALAESCGDWADFDELDRQIRTERDPAFANHLPVYRIQALLQEINSELPFDNMHKFLVVRNPYDRLVSLYEHRLRKLDLTYEGKPRNTAADKHVACSGFKPWLLRTPNAGDRILTRTAQLHWANGAASEDVAVITFELINDQWPVFAEQHDLTSHLPRLNVRESHRHYQDYYDDETRAHVERYFHEDLRFGDYTF